MICTLNCTLPTWGHYGLHNSLLVLKMTTISCKQTSLVTVKLNYNELSGTMDICSLEP
jgi:hypothetical protein